MNCPMCQKQLFYSEPKIRGFSLTDPYVKCECGFSCIEKIERIGIVGKLGKSGFESDRIQANKAARKLLQRFEK